MTEPTQDCIENQVQQLLKALFGMGQVEKEMGLMFLQSAEKRLGEKAESEKLKAEARP